MKTKRKIAAFLAALAVSIAYGYCCVGIPAVSEAIAARGNLNLLTYGSLLILFCLLFFIFYAVLCRVKMAEEKKLSILGSIILLLATVGVLLFFVKMIQMEGNIYGGTSERYVWHKLPLWLCVLCMAAILVVFFLCYWKNSVKISQKVPCILYGMLTVLIGYTFYTPGIFVRGYSDRMHAHAYYNSIYNALHGSPYGEQATSIYGHYGILYRLPMKILGGDFIDFILLNAILGALCFLPMFLALHLTVRNNLLRILGALAMTFPVLSMRGGFYWQLWPHRIVFMSLMICLGAIWIGVGKWKVWFCLGGYVLSFLGIIWNTESGMFCAIAWAGFWILQYLCKNPWRTGRMLLNWVLHLAGVILAFAGAYGAVNLYNLFAGGTINSIQEFLFPLLTTSYMDDLLRVNLTLFPSAYMPMLGLFFLAVAWGISYMSFFKGNEERNPSRYLPACFGFFTGALALGQMSYFMNRAAYHNLDICHLPAILLICLLAERGMEFVRTIQWKERKEWTMVKVCQGSFTAVSLSVLLTVTTGMLLQYGFNTDIKVPFHNKQDIHEFAAHIAANIPEDTYGFGIGVPEIYSMLRWDTGCYTLDFSDISVRPEVADLVIQDIKEKGIRDFLVGENTMTKLENFSSDGNQWIQENFQLDQEFEFQGAIFQYYVKK